MIPVRENSEVVIIYPDIWMKKNLVELTTALRGMILADDFFRRIPRIPRRVHKKNASSAMFLTNINQVINHY